MTRKNYEIMTNKTSLREIHFDKNSIDEKV